MKKILFLCLIALGFIFTSCSKEENVIEENVIEESVADKFVGKYSVYCNSISYGNSMINTDSLLVITKISDNEIEANGYFNTIGFVADTNHIYFEPLSYNSIQETSSIEFTGGVLEGNVLTFGAIWHYMYGWNGPGGMMNGGTSNVYFTAYKN